MNDKQSNTYLQAGLAAGYLCRRTEEELHAIAAATSGAVLEREIAGWVGKFLLSKASGELLDNSQPVPQVRGGTARRHALGAGPKTLHVRPRRRLSRAARLRISVAQRKRWARQKAVPIKQYWAAMSAEDRKIEMRRRMAMRKKAA
jgi:hypothetical protein